MTPETAAVIVAVIGLIGTWGTTLLSQRKTRAKVDNLSSTVEAKVENLHAEVRTNHGKQAFEYLEMIEDIKKSQDSMSTAQNALFVLLAEHTAQDARQFAELGKLLDEKAA